VLGDWHFYSNWFWPHYGPPRPPGALTDVKGIAFGHCVPPFAPGQPLRGGYARKV